MPRSSPSPRDSEPPRVGETLAGLRQQQGLSMDELSRRAGVSKSMLSQIERAQANPTVAVVWRLANALGVPVAELLGSPDAPPAAGVTLVPLHDQPALRGPDGGSELRILGPIELAGRFEWYSLHLQPGGSLDSQAHERGTVEHLTAVSGAIEVRCAGNSRKLRPGDTARYPADQAHAIRNAGKSAASAWLVVVHPG